MMKSGKRVTELSYNVKISKMKRTKKYKSTQRQPTEKNRLNVIN